MQEIALYALGIDKTQFSQMSIKSSDPNNDQKIYFSLKEGPGLAIQEKIMSELLTVIG